jgi:DNA-binding NtrC family response regulator
MAKSDSLSEAFESARDEARRATSAIGNARAAVARIRATLARTRKIVGMRGPISAPYAPHNTSFVVLGKKSLARVEWEYIHHVLAKNDGSVSAAARALGLHRRTLQRKLQKHAPALPRN